MRFVSYIRVSTQRQGQSGLGIEAQRNAVRQYVTSVGGELVGEYLEVESGKKDDRPQLINALKHARRIKATLLIAKIDRLARNVAFIANLLQGDVEVKACDMPEANRLTWHILGAVAEHEREMISQRVRVALAAAKARGTKLGNPQGAKAFGSSYKVGAEKARQAACQRASDLAPVVQEIMAQGYTSLRQIGFQLDLRDLPAPRGGKWGASQVRNLLRQVSGCAVCSCKYCNTALGYQITVVN
jgi:DNA invertase Pin-like site-specific DNA recombinase